MKLAEKILAGLIVLALILKLFQIPGGGVLLVLTMSLLANVYFIAGFAFFNGIRLRNIFKKSAYEGVSPLRIVGAVGTGICLANIVIGILFILQYWPGGTAQIVITFIPLLVIVGLSIFKMRTNKDAYYPRILTRIAIIGGIALLFILMPRGTLLKIQYRNHPKYIEAFNEYNRNPSDANEAKLDMEYMRMTLSPGEFEDYQKNYESNIYENY